MKSYILKKEAKRRNYIQGTGGGSPPKIPFSSFEEEVLQLLTPEAAGMENIPEGGIIDTEETVQECGPNNDYYEIDEQNMLSHPEVEEDNIENASPNIDKRKQKNINTVTQKNSTKKGDLKDVTYNERCKKDL